MTQQEAIQLLADVVSGLIELLQRVDATDEEAYETGTALGRLKGLANDVLTQVGAE